MIKTRQGVLVAARLKMLFLDNLLPDGQGLEQVKRLKEKSPTTAIVVMTAMESVRDAVIDIVPAPMARRTRLRSSLSSLR